MSDEIKMILDDWKFVNNGEKNYIVEVPSIHIRQILNYITDLQEEVKSANESITWWQNRFNALQQENERLTRSVISYDETLLKRNNEYEDYKSRCDKALDKLYCYGEVFDSKILQEFQKEMENILNGGDKNV